MTTPANATFAEKLAALCSLEMAKARRGQADFGEMIERLAASLGMTIAIAAQGDGPTIDGLMQGAEAHAHDEAVRQAPLGKMTAAFSQRGKP